MKKLFKEVDPVTENKTIDETVETTEDTSVEPVEGVTEIKPEPKKEKPAVKTGKVTATSLNIRADASLTAPVVRVVPINTELKIIDENKDFFYVEGPDNVRGFCKKDFISIA